jgi:D-alanyl-D-alanine carboxypeptidase
VTRASCLLTTALVIGVVSGCGGSGPTASPSPATTAGATGTSASVQPTPAPTPGRIVAPTPIPMVFPTSAYAALSDEPVPAEVAAKLQAVLNAMAEVTDGVGFAATVMTPEGTWSGASGTSDGVHEVAVDSQFGIASGTKPIIAAQVMRLVEAGEVSLDAPATDYLPADFTFDTNGATIRQLLSHRSGIPDWYGAVEQQLAEDRTRVWELDDILALVGPTRLPVDRFEYADTNYNLLGLVIEHVRGKPLVEVLRDGVLRVDGTERLIYQPDEAPTDPIAMPRGESRDALEKGGGYLPSLSDASADGPAGAGASDSLSLARWWRTFCAGEVVSQASLNEMATLYENGEIDYGLGLFNPAQRASVPAVGHLGANFGYKSSAGCLIEDPVVFVVLTNGADVDSFGLAPPLVRAALSD